jgi:hypothetical protein
LALSPIVVPAATSISTAAGGDEDLAVFEQLAVGWLEEQFVADSAVG